MDPDSLISSKLHSLLNSGVHPESEDFELQLSKFDLALTTTTTNLNLELNGQSLDLEIENGSQFTARNSKSWPSTGISTFAFDCSKTAGESMNSDITLDTFILSLLQVLSQDFSTILKFDDSLLQTVNRRQFEEITSSLHMESHEMLNFLSVLMKIKSQPISKFENVLKIGKIVRCFEENLAVNLCVHIWDGGDRELVCISKEERNFDSDLEVQKPSKNIFLTKTSTQEFRAIVPRRKLYRDLGSYGICVANDILKYKLFQSYFDSWTSSQSDFNSLILNTIEIYTILLTKCRSVTDIIEQVFPNEPEDRIYPLPTLKKLLTDKNLDKDTEDEITKIVKKNIEMEFFYSTQNSTAKKLEDDNRNHNLFLNIEKNAGIMMSEAQAVCDQEKQRMAEIIKEVLLIEVNQGIIIPGIGESNVLECTVIRENISKANAYVSWVKFKLALSQLELVNCEDFMNFDLSSLKTLSETVLHIKNWFRSPEGTYSPDFIRYIEHDFKPDVDLRECIRILKHIQTMNVNVSLDNENTVEVTGIHINLSQVLARIPKSGFSEIRVLASGTLLLDVGLRDKPGVNILLCGKHVIVPNAVKIDTSGINGCQFPENEKTAPDALITGGDGQDGKAGEDGTSGGNVTIIANIPITNIQLGNIEICCDGGNGADGQNGGNAQDGRKGEDGRIGHISEIPGPLKVWSTRKIFDEGSPGRPGGIGGKGGKPGAGGKAGRGGQITVRFGGKGIQLSEYPTGKFKKANGIPGNDGDWGNPGDFGKGGRNGYDHGWVTESFWWLDDWIEGKGKLEFEEVSTWLKSGWKMVILKSKDEVQNSFAQITNSHKYLVQNNSRSTSTSVTHKFQFVEAKMAINLESRSMKTFLANWISENEELNQALWSAEEIHNQSNNTAITSIDKNISTLTLESIRVKMDEKSGELHQVKEKLTKCKSSITTSKAIAESARREQLLCQERIDQLKAGMKTLKGLHDKFTEENRMMTQTQEQTEIRISSDWCYNDATSSATDYSLQTISQLNSRTMEFKPIQSYDPQHQYIIFSKEIMKNLENRDKSVHSAFEECFQATLFNCTTILDHGEIQLLPSVYEIIQKLSSSAESPSLRGYNFLEFVSKIFPSDVHTSLVYQHDQIFVAWTQTVFAKLGLTSINNSSSNNQSNVIENIFKLRVLHLNAEQLINLDTLLLTPDEKQKPHGALRNILQDILERNSIEMYVEQVLRRQEKSTFRKIASRTSKIPGQVYTNFSKGMRSAMMYFENPAEDVRIEVGESPTETDLDSRSEDEDEDNFENIEKSEIHFAQSEVQEDNQNRGILTDQEVRQLAQTALNVYRDLKNITPNLKLINCLNPKILNAKNYISRKIINPIENLIRSCTRHDMDSMVSNIRLLCNSGKNMDNKTRKIYTFLIAKLEIDLVHLSTLYQLTSEIGKIHNDDFHHLIYKIYEEKFKNSWIKKLRNFNQYERYSNQINLLVDQVESEFSELSLVDRIKCYDSVLKLEKEAFIENLTEKFLNLFECELFTNSKLGTLSNKFNGKQRLGLRPLYLCDSENKNVVQLSNLPVLFQDIMMIFFKNEPLLDSEAFIRKAFPKLCMRIRVHRQSLPFASEDFRVLSQFIIQVESISEGKKYVADLKKELSLLVHAQLKFRMDGLKRKFDLDGKVWLRCVGIQEMIEKVVATINEDLNANQQRILYHFEILLQRIHLVLIELGKSDEIELLTDQIEKMRLDCPELEQFLCQLNSAFVDFLNIQMAESRKIITKSAIFKKEIALGQHTMPNYFRELMFAQLNDFGMFHKSLVEKIIVAVPDKPKLMTPYDQIIFPKLINDITSTFMTNHSLKSLPKLLCMPETHSDSESENETKYQNMVVIPLKQILNLKIQKMITFTLNDNMILKTIQDLRNTLNWSTRTIYEEKIYSHLRKARQTQKATVESTIKSNQEILTKLFDLFPKSSKSTEPLIEFMEFCGGFDVDLTQLTDFSFLNRIVKTFVSKFLLPSFDDRNFDNVCELLFQTISTFTLNDNILGFEKENESEYEKCKRFEFTRILEHLVDILGNVCWLYLENMDKLLSFLEEHLSEYSKTASKKNIIKSTEVFLQKILKKLTEIGMGQFEKPLQEQINQIAYHMSDTDTGTEKWFLLAYICLSFSKKEQTDGQNWEWKFASEILQNRKEEIMESWTTNPIRTSKRKDFPFKKAISLILLTPAISGSEIERLLLFKILREWPHDKSPTSYQILQILLNLEHEYCKFETTFWYELFKSDIPNIFSIDETRLINQISNFNSKNEVKESIKFQLSELLYQTSPNMWCRSIRNFLIGNICQKFFTPDNMAIEIREDWKIALENFHYFSRKHEISGEEKFFKILKNLCSIFQAVGSPTNEFKMKFLKYSAHISLDELNLILKSKLPENWMISILKIRLRTIVKEILNNFNCKERLEDLIKNIETNLAKIKDPLDLEAFVLHLGDNLLKEFPENCDYIFSNLEDICVCVSHQKLTNALLAELKYSALSSWKACFRKAKLHEMGLSRNLTTLIINIESTISSPKITTKLLKKFRKYFPIEINQNESILNEILIKIDSGEWFLDEEILSNLESGKSDIRNYFANCAIGNRGKVLEGAELVKELMNDPINKHLKYVLKETMLSDILKIKIHLTSSEYYLDTDVCNKWLNEWTKTDIQKWTRNIKQEIREMSLIAKFAHLMSQKCKILAIICRAVLITKRFPPWDTQLFSVLIFLEGVGQNISGRLGQISTGEGKTLITGIVAIFWALAGSNVNIITSTHILAEENEKDMRPIFEIFKISLGNNCDRKCKEGGDKEKKICYSNQVIYGDISSFQSDILHVENCDKDFFGNREVDFVFVDEVDSLFLDKGGHMLYISHSISEFRYLRPIFVKIWEVINRNAEKDVIKSIKIVREEIKSQEILVPNFLEDFVKKRMEIWVENGYHAKSLVENDPYIVSDKGGQKVTIIDKDTGVEQSTMQYSFGLHQFIELKHYDRLSCETLKAIFMSNFSYFQRYRGKLYGITGTLGSEKSREIMSRVYKVDIFCMKRRKVRYCPQTEGKVSGNETDWLESIKNSVLGQIGKGRAVLVIGRNVMDVRKIKGHLQPIFLPGTDFNPDRFLSYESSTDTNFTSYIRENEIPQGMVIVGTNLAGRGMDLMISPDIVDGLHVILTYIPTNSRIEEQAFGRTARKGEAGSTEFIVHDKDSNLTIQDLRRSRELREDDRLDKIDKIQLKQIEIEEELFKKFREYSKKLETCENFQPLKEDLIKLYLEFIQNRWAIWLDLMNDRIKNWKIFEEKNITAKFSEFEREINYAIETNSLAKSPSELVKLAKFYENKGNIDKSLELLSSAIESEPHFSEIPIYYKAACLLKKDPNSKNVRLEAVKLLKRARHIIRRNISNFELLPSAVDDANIQRNTGREIHAQTGINFMKQITNQCELLEKHCKCIDDAIGVSVNETLFRAVVGVSESAEALDLLEVTQERLKMLKGYRFSKNILIDGEKLLLERKEIQLPFTFEYCHDQVIELIRRNTNISVKILNNLIMTKEKFWEQLKNLMVFESIVQCNNEYRISFFEDKFLKLNFTSSLSHHKVAIGLILEDNNKNVYDKSIFNTLDHLLEFELENIEALLRIAGILEETKTFVGNLKPQLLATIDFNTRKFPSELKKYSVILEECLRNEKNSVLSYLAFDKIPLCANKDVHLESRRLLQELIAIGLVKECKVDLSFDRDFEKVDTKMTEFENAIDNLKKDYTTVFEIYHGKHPKTKSPNSLVKNESHKFTKDYDELLAEYLKSIKVNIRNSIGTLKSTGRVRTDFEHIENNYHVSKFPHEIVEFIQCDFERVLKFCETVPWYMSGSFTVAILGVLQISASIGLLFVHPSIGMGLLSEGLGDIYYGYSVGYTNPNFSWSDYGIQKALNICASAITCGIDIEGGLTIKRIGIEVGEELVKRTILKKVCQQIGLKISGSIIHECFSYLRTLIFKRFHSLFANFLPTFPGYDDQIKILRLTLHRLFRVSYEENQAKTIIMDSLNFLWNEEHSVFYTALYNVMAKIGPQILGLISSAISESFRTVGSKFTTAFEGIICFIQWQKIMTALQDLGHLAENSIRQLNNHLQLITDNLETQRQLRFSGATIKTNDYDIICVDDYYIPSINQELINKILVKLQEDLAEPYVNKVAESALLTGLQMAFDDKRQKILSKLVKHGSGRRSNSEIHEKSKNDNRNEGQGPSSRSHIDIYFRENIHWDTIVENGSMSVRQLHDQYGDSLKIFQDKYGKCYADL